MQNNDNRLVPYESDVEWADIKRNWEPLKELALDGVNSAQSRRSYDAALDKWLGWYDNAPEPRPRFFSKACVNAFRADQENKGLASSTINVRLSAVRKLVAEASDNGLIAPDLAAAIARVKNLKKLGIRTGNWLTKEQSDQLLNIPDAATLAGKRDRVILGLLLGCGLRRGETCRVTFEQIQKRDGRWVIVDLIGKGRRIRSVPMPDWTKALIDDWAVAARIRDGYLLRPVNRGDHLSGDRIRNNHSIWLDLKRYSGQVQPGLAPCDLRRTFAQLAHKGRAPLEQIQLSLGHESIQTTERYLGIRQDLADAPCDHLGLSPRVEI